MLRLVLNSTQENMIEEKAQETKAKIGKALTRDGGE